MSHRFTASNVCLLCDFPANCCHSEVAHDNFYRAMRCISAVFAVTRCLSVCLSVCHVRGVWQALNCLSIHATYCVIVAGASQGETKMWAAVRENGDVLHLRFE